MFNVMWRMTMVTCTNLTNDERYLLLLCAIDRSIDHAVADYYWLPILAISEGEWRSISRLSRPDVGERQSLVWDSAICLREEATFVKFQMCCMVIGVNALQTLGVLQAAASSHSVAQNFRLQFRVGVANPQSSERGGAVAGRRWCRLKERWWVYNK